jgi:hypothetical protein
MMTTFRPAALLALCALTLCACSPGAPEGVNKEALDDAVSRAIGDPNTCVMIAEASSGKVVYRYNSHTACANRWPACETPETRAVADLLKLTVADGRERKLSCNTQADASRGVGWAAGPIASKAGGKPYVYAAVMEGGRAFPGRMMADRLSGAFARVGL